MKKFLIILGVVFIILITAIIVLPMIFKDDIRKALDDTMAESLNATVYYDIDEFSLSLIKNFPDITVSMSDFGVIGAEEFEKDTLASIGTFLVTVDLMSVINGDQIIVEEILLDRPEIKVLVLPDGKANYDIAKESSEQPIENTDQENSDEEEVSNAGGESISVGIEKWSIKDGTIIYNDKSMNLFTSIVGLNHEGSGDFTLDVFDLETKTTVDAVSMGFEGTEYVSNKSLALDIILNMNLAEMTFTFKENRIAVNQFAMQADGFVSMPGNDINMDITFGGKDISLKSILSLIPGVFQEYLDGVDAGGQIGFDGYVKGTFNETSMPKVAANLAVDNGMISYADLNIPMENINIKTSFNYPSADLKETSFNVDKFSMLVDGESVEAYLKFKNLENYQWDLGFDGNADLEKITKIVPLEGMTLLGKINAKLNTAGQMSDVEAEQYDKLPTTGSLTISDFLFKSADLPQGFGISRANLSFNPSEINLSEFNAKSGNSDFSMGGKITNYLAFALSENELLTGQLNFNSNLIDINELMPEESMEDESDETNTDDPVSSEQTSDEGTQEVVKIPENIDFTLASSINKIAYSNLSINNFKGKILIKDGAIILDENRFEMLDGTFELTGSYVTKDLDKPKYDLGFKIKDLSIGSAFDAFETVQNYAPIAKQVTGRFSSDFKVNGLLGEDMMPIMNAIDLTGLVSIAEAALEKGDFMQKLSSVAALKTGASSQPSKKINLKNVAINTSIKDGRMYVEPFELEVNGQKAVVGGNNGLDGSLDYSMLLKDIPTGQIGNALNSALSSFTGGKKLVADKINLNLGIGGNYDDPTVKLLGTSNASGESGGTTEAFKKQLTDKVDEQKAKAEAELAKQKAEAEAKAKAELDKKKEEQRQKIISEAQAQATQIRNQGKASAEKVRKEGYAAADKLVSDAGSNPIKKKLAQEASKKLKAETDQKAAKIISESNNKADKIVAEAKAKAAKI